ncbi:MAG: permease-like cell division protein FtsX [Bacteroidales bacterium]|nr:permease-like cell division protein FtsX [Bacteroidales bacterium]
MKRSKVNLWETHSSTILSITLVLFLLGLCMMVEYHFYRATHDMQERITYKVDLVADITDEDAQQLKATIEAMPYVKHVDYISREKAAEIFTEVLDDDFVGFIGYNPLYPSMMVNLKADYLPDATNEIRRGGIDRFENEVRGLEYVVGVAYQENVVNHVNSVFYKATWFLIVFMVLLILVSILMIRSTIGISLFSQREAIRTMQLVGAKRAFISQPYLARSVWYGLLGAVFALLALAISLGVFNQSLGGLDLLSSTHMIWYAGIAALVIILGIILSFLSTLSALHRYLAY